MGELFNFKNNQAILGMTIQKVVCDFYDIKPNINAISQFNTSYDIDVARTVLPFVKRIFADIGYKPTECLTFSPSRNGKETFSPHNFLLQNGMFLSIRTNKTRDKVAPRVVGQCGLERFNEHFSQIAGYEIEHKKQIKSLIFEKIHLMLPIFIDYLFVSDYTVWLYTFKDKLEYTIIEANKIVDINFNRAAFSFTKGIGEWNESTTLKYNGKSLAEIQIHKNRTFKFRFIMSSLLDLLVEQKINSETLGMTAEKTICDLFKLEYPKNFYKRCSVRLEETLFPVVKKAFNFLPNAVKHTGSMRGERGGESKCSYDFLLKGSKELSLKTNTGKMVCPPEVGQPCAKTCFMYFKDFISEDHIDGEIFKRMVLENIEKLIPIYINHLFDSDFLLWIFKSGNNFDYRIFKKGFAFNMVWKKDFFSFSKPTLEVWSESNSVKYKGISIGEFQVHKERNCFKFRFNLENLMKVVEENEK